jgi:hypothetical protein
MQVESKQVPDDPIVERAVVLQVLRDDHPGCWTRAELVSSIEPRAVQAALTQLEVEGVVILDGEMVTASRSALRLDALGLICV